MRSDPALQPSRTRNVLGRLAGALAGGAAGYLNASGKGIRADPGVGARIGDSIVNKDYNKATRDFGEKRAALEAQAQIQAANAAEQRKAAESEARMASEKAQEEAARAARAKAERVEAPRPVPPPAETRSDVIARRKREAVEDLGLVPGTPEYKRYLAEEKFYEPPKTPAKPGIAEVVSGREKEADRLGLKGEERTAYSLTGSLPRKPTPRVGRSSGGSAAASKAGAEAEMMRLLQAAGGDHDKAVAAAKTAGVRKLLQEDKRRTKLGSSAPAGGDRIARLKAALAAPGAPAAPSAGPVTVKVPNGKTYTFPNQEAADKFKREAGIK